MKPYHASNAFTAEEARKIFNPISRLANPAEIPTSVCAPFVAAAQSDPTNASTADFLAAALSAHIRAIRRRLERAGRAKFNVLEWFLSEAATSQQLARFLLARTTHPGILTVRNFNDAAALLEAHPRLDATRANTEGTYHIFTQFNDRGTERQGSYTGSASQQVVGASCEDHVFNFAKGTTGQPGLYRRETLVQMYLLVTVAPNSYPRELEDLWRQCTGKAFPNKYRGVICPIVCDLDALILADFFGDIWSQPLPGEALASSGFLLPRAFVGLNDRSPAGSRGMDNGLRLLEIADALTVRRSQEEQRVQDAAALCQRRKADYTALCRGIPAKALDGYIVSTVGGRRYTAEIPDEWHLPAEVTVSIRHSPPASKMPPKSAPALIHRFLKATQVAIDGREVDFTGIAVGDSSWSTLLNELAECQLTALFFAEPLRRPLAITARPSLDELGMSLTDSLGASFICGFGGTVELPQMPLRHIEWFAALEQGQRPPTGLVWTLPTFINAVEGDKIVLRADAVTNPLHLNIHKQGVRKAYHIRSHHVMALILVNVARHILGLPRRLAPQVWRSPALPHSEVDKILGEEDDYEVGQDSDDDQGPSQRARQ
ncbi:unnamed protein product [Parajaminaea phylloscopi]